MKRSYLTAAGMALAATAWILSGHFGQKGEANGKVAQEAVAAKEEKAPTRVRVRAVTVEERAGDLVLFGRTEADRRVEVRAETAGRVAEVVATKGERLDKGAAIARLAMDDRQARLAEAEARIDEARMSYDAGRKLAEKAFRSQVTVADEKAKLGTARAAVEAIRVEIDKTTIRAPFDGVLDALPVNVGDYLDVAGAVATVIDLDPILIAVEVAEKDVGRLAVGGKARARLIDGRSVDGRIRYVSKAGTMTTRTFRVEVEVPNPDNSIAEGLTAEVHLETGSRHAHRIPRSVLTLADDGALGVKTVETDGTVAFHAVSLVADAPDGLWISGLPDRATLITLGQEFVRPGQKVEPVPETPEGAP
jgi:multidrug efflux system membrane fusion protein